MLARDQNSSSASEFESNSAASAEPRSATSVESARLQALLRYEILDTLPEQAYNDITLLASSICETPISLISLIDEARQWFKSKVGLEISHTSRTLSFCTHAIQNPDELMIVPNALEDKRFENNALVTGDPNIRFYAGAPLVTSDGLALGTLCVIDRKPRELTEVQKNALAALSRQVMAQLELRYLNIINTRNSAEARQATMSARMLAEQVQDLYNNAPCGYHSLNKNGEFILINDTELQWLGYEREELLGQSFTKVIPSESHEEFLRDFNSAKETGTRRGLEIEMQRKDGTRFCVLLNASMVRDEKGEVVSTRSSVVDISMAKAANDALRESEARFQTFMDNGPMVVAIKDENGCYLYANQQTLQRFNKSYEEFVGHCDIELWPVETYRAVHEHDAKVLAGERTVAQEQVVPMPDGTTTHWLSFKFPLRDSVGKKLLGAIGIDITDRKYYEQQLQQYQQQLEDAVTRLEEVAITDALTQLKNHGAFIARLEEEVARAHRYQTPLALLMLDADNFKQYNDTFGHPEGDKVLRTIADCLKSCIRPSDFAARYGGEEFAVILGNTDINGAQAFAERIRYAVENVAWPHRKVTISVGVAAFDKERENAVKLLSAADEALYEAKRSGKNRVASASSRSTPAEYSAEHSAEHS